MIVRAHKQTLLISSMNETMDVMETIHHDEVLHVTTGHRWFPGCVLLSRAWTQIATFREEVRRGWRRRQLEGAFQH